MPTQGGGDQADQGIGGHVESQHSSCVLLRYHLGDGTVGDDVEQRPSCHHEGHQRDEDP